MKRRFDTVAYNELEKKKFFALLFRDFKESRLIAAQIHDFIDSAILESSLELLERVRPALVQENDKTLISINPHLFQDGIYWGRKMVNEKIDSIKKELQEGK